MPNQPKPGAVLFAKSLQRIARFYEELLPMTVVLAERDRRAAEVAGDAQRDWPVCHYAGGQDYR